MVVVQLACRQVTQISEGGEVDIALRGGEQIYADLQVQEKRWCHASLALSTGNCRGCCGQERSTLSTEYSSTVQEDDHLAGKIKEWHSAGTLRDR